MALHESASIARSENTRSPAPCLRRLTRQMDPPKMDAPLIDTPQPTSSIARKNVLRPADNHTQRSIGTVVHLALQELSQLEVLPTAISDKQRHRWRVALQREGVWGEALDTALQAVLNSVSQTLRAESPGRWILSPDHADAHSEWALTTVDVQGQIRDIIIDRCFVDHSTGERWVIDFKTSQPAATETLEEFTLRESFSYFEQLHRYREALRGLGSEPLRCALFFTALGYLHTVPELDLQAAKEGTGP
jgi:ATP-dependent helicase/nuclease subunit A